MNWLWRLLGAIAFQRVTATINGEEKETSIVNFTTEQLMVIASLFLAATGEVLLRSLSDKTELVSVSGYPSTSPKVVFHG